MVPQSCGKSLRDRNTGAHHQRELQLQDYPTVNSNSLTQTIQKTETMAQMTGITTLCFTETFLSYLSDKELENFY